MDCKEAGNRRLAAAFFEIEKPCVVRSPPRVKKSHCDPALYGHGQLIDAIPEHLEA